MKPLHDGSKDLYFQRLFMICSTVYIYSKGECNQPVHMYISDLIDKSTDSSDDTLKILNHFGLCVSPTTFTNFQKEKAAQHIDHLQKEIKPHMFSVATFDNVNKRAKFAKVKASDSKRGFDGTSVMIIQPKPQTIKLSPEEETDFMKKCSFDHNGRAYLTQVVGTQQGLSLFNAVICILNNSLCLSSRDVFGCPTNSKLSRLEKDLANGLKSLAVNEVIDNMSYFQTIWHHLSPITKGRYTNMLQRMEHIITDHHEPSLPELMTLTKVLRWPIVIYKLQGGELSIVRSYKPVVMSKLSPISLLLSSSGCYTAMIYEDNYYNAHSLISIKDGHIDLSVLHSLSKVSEETLYYSQLYSESLFDNKQDKLEWATSTIKMAADCHMEGGVSLNPTMSPESLHSIDYTSLSVEQFAKTAQQEDTAVSFEASLFTYNVGKHAHHITKSCGRLPGMKVFNAMQDIPDTEKSNLVYVEVLRLNADREDTVVRVLNDIATTVGVGTRVKYVMVIGDAQTYKQLRKVKEKYGSKLNWVLPYIGDWHLLLNYLHAIMKLYKSVGLDTMVYNYHSGATAVAVLDATSFDKTMNFLLEAWEAMYRHQIQQFIHHHAEDCDKDLIDVIARRFSKWTKDKRAHYRSEDFSVLYY